MAANKEVADYIRKRAIALGADPETALKVSRAEALNVFDPSKPDLGGDEGSSFGPFQLHYKGMSKSMPNAGMGDDFTAATGLHASDPSTWPQQVDFALNKAVQGGWGPWMGAKAAGVGTWDGLPRNGGITMGSAQGPSGQVAPGTIMPPLNAAPGIPTQTAAAAPLGDQLGGAIFGDDLAAKLKGAFGADAPATGPGKAGLGIMASALGGGAAKDRQAQIDRDNASIQANPNLGVDDSARMQAGQQLMTTLLSKMRKPTGIRMG
jgi:hypothetical protein